MKPETTTKPPLILFQYINGNHNSHSLTPRAGDYKLRTAEAGNVQIQKSKIYLPRDKK